MNIAIIGAGNASLTLMDYFLSNANIEIVGIADIKEDAPGITRATELGVPTTTRMETLIENPKTQLIIELTGNQKVQQTISKLLRRNQQIMTAEAARLMYAMIRDQKQKDASNAEKLSGEFQALAERLNSAAGSTDASLKEVDGILRSMKILAVNAGIEAVRAGEFGKPFGVVADEMKKLVETAGTALQSTTQASQETHSTLKDLFSAEKKITEIFQLDGQPKTE